MTQTELTPTASLTGKWKRYPAYKDSGVEWLGEIPTHWEVERLKFNSYIKGRIGWQNLRSDEFTDTGPYLITGMHFKQGSIDWDICYHITEERYKMAPEIQVKEHDVLITKDGSIGKVAYIEYLPEKASLNSHLLVIRPLRKRYIPRYLYYLLLSSVFRSYIFLNQAGSTFFGISQESVVNFPMMLPTLQEQDTVAAFLDRETARINTLIAKKERLIDLLQEKRAALISHAVTKGLDPTVPMKDSGVEWLGEIPVHWEVRRLKNVAQNGFVNGLFKKKDQFGSGTKLVNVVDLYRDSFLIDFESLDRVETEQEEYETFKVLSGDIFFVRSSLKLEGVGSSASINEVPEPTVFECHVVRMRPSSNLMVSKYLINYLNSPLVRQRLVALAETTTMTTIAQPKLASLEVIVPPISEQQVIATYLDRETAKIDALISRIREDIEKLKEYSTALISAAVMGKIDVRGDS